MNFQKLLSALHAEHHYKDTNFKFISQMSPGPKNSPKNKKGKIFNLQNFASLKDIVLQC